MPIPKPTFLTQPDFKQNHGKRAFMNLSDYNEKNPLQLYRSDKDESKLIKRDYIMFYGTDPRGIKSYMEKQISNKYWEWTLSEVDNKLNLPSGTSFEMEGWSDYFAFEWDTEP